MKIKHESGADFTFAPPQHNNTLQQQQMMHSAGYDTSFNDSVVAENFYNQIMTPVTDETSPPSTQNSYSQPTGHPQNSFYQQQSYSQPELQHISHFNMSNQSINHIKEEPEEEVTIESILDDDPLLSFTTTLDRQESNDTILQSSSPIKGPDDGVYNDIEHLNLNHHNHSHASLVKQESPEHISVPPPMTNFPTPANSTSGSGVNSTQSPINNSTLQFQQQQQQFTPHYSSQPQFQQPHIIAITNNKVPMVSRNEPFVPANTTPNGSHLMMKMDQSQQQLPIQNFRMQIQNQAFFQPQFRNPLAQQQNFGEAQMKIQQPPPQMPPQHILPQQQQQQQPSFMAGRPAPIRVQTASSIPLKTSSVQTINTPVTIRSQELKLPPTPPSASQPPLNKSSSTTRLSKVKKNSVSGPSTSTLKLKKSKSFLNSSPSVKDPKPFFTTLDFSKQLNGSHNTFINKDKKFPKSNPIKGNVIKNYEFVIEQGHEKVKNSSAANSAKSTPRRPSTAGTPTSTTSIKFPKLPKPPSIEKSSFALYSPTNPNSSPTNSDASGHSPLNSSQQYPYVNPSPIPSSIARFDNGDGPLNITSSPITGEQVFFKPSSSQRSSVSQTSPEKHPSPPYQKDMKSGMNEFRARIHK